MQGYGIGRYQAVLVSMEDSDKASPAKVIEHCKSLLCKSGLLFANTACQAGDHVTLARDLLEAYAAADSSLQRPGENGTSSKPLAV